jgi:hypothetical protein
MKDFVQLFLETEISDQDYYDGIMSFILSSNIRRGEYECNQFIVKKMDLRNFLVFEEFEINKKREIHNAFSISKHTFTKTINEHAKKQGITVKKYKEISD